MSSRDTTGASYTKRLSRLEYKKWKSVLDVQRPYRMNIKSLKPGKTLDIGCGIGRYLKHLPAGSVGIDHNKHSIAAAKDMGLVAYTTTAFKKQRLYGRGYFDSILLSHVLEHMTPKEAVALIKEYLPLLTEHGRVIVCCPQEKGYTTDETHVTFLDRQALHAILEQAELRVITSRSFPFPRAVGKVFTYNEFVVVGQKP